MMNNEELFEAIKTLKNEGVSYKEIYDNSNIPKSTFFYYMKNQRFPYKARQRIEMYIKKEFKELLKYE